MASTYWIKLYHEILDDPKMGHLGHRHWRRAIELMLVAGEIDKQGHIPSTSELAWRLRCDLDELSEDLEALERVEIIAQDANGWIVVHFTERQAPASDADRQRKRRKRDTEHQYYGHESVTKRDTDKIRSDKKRKDKKRGQQEQLTGDTPPVLAPPPTLPSGIPDPSSMTVAQIKKLKLTKDQWRALGAAEARGKNRAGVHSLVERKTHAAPPAVEAFRELTNAYPSKAVWPVIASAVGDAPEGIVFWKQVVTGYIALGWNERNVANMLDFFNRREIPSARGAAHGQRSSGRAGTPSRITPKPPVTDANTPTPEQLASDRRAVDKHLKQQREAAAEAAATAGTG